MTDVLPVIGAHVGVKDEVELLPLALEHLRRIGVGPVTVFDMHSTDGTREWLAKVLPDRPELQVIDCPPDATEASLITDFAQNVRQFKADWVLMLDADEFPLPRSGDLRHDLSEAEGDIVTLRRHNVALGPSGALLPLPVTPADYPRIPLYIRRDPTFAKTLRNDPADYWLRGVPSAKVAVRPGRLERFAAGMHGAFTNSEAEAAQAVSPDIIVAHLALTTFDRFARKIANVRALFEKYGDDFPKGFGWHWHRWVQLAERGELRAEYDRSICFDQDLARLKAEGAVASAEDVIKGLG